MTDNNRKLLIVDDEDAIRESLALAFEIQGYLVQTAPDGAEALKMLETDKIDVVVSDIRMPNKDGVTLLKNIKEKPSSPFVILMSAYSEYTEQDVKNLGAVALIKKPLNFDQLLKLIANLK